jgi:hypothetical protein
MQELELRPTLVLNPPDDDDFRFDVEAMMESGLVRPFALQDCLRRRYSRAIVRPRELAGEQNQIWYVYRDGRWVRPGR